MFQHQCSSFKFYTVFRFHCILPIWCSNSLLCFLETMIYFSWLFFFVFVCFVFIFICLSRVHALPVLWMPLSHPQYMPFKSESSFAISPKIIKLPPLNALSCPNPQITTPMGLWGFHISPDPVGIYHTPLLTANRVPLTIPLILHLIHPSPTTLKTLDISKQVF